VARILIVDRDALVLSALSAAFKERGHEVEIAGTLAAGLEAIEQRPPSAILLSVEDPHDRDWKLFLREMLTRALPMPLVLLGEQDAFHRHLAEHQSSQ